MPKPTVLSPCKYRGKRFPDSTRYNPCRNRTDQPESTFIDAVTRFAKLLDVETPCTYRETLEIGRMKAVHGDISHSEVFGETNQ